MRKGKLHALTIPSSWGRPARKFQGVTGEYVINLRKGWKFPEITRACVVLFAHIVSCQVRVLCLGGDLSVIMRQRQLSHTLGLIYAGAAVVVWLEPVQGSGLLPF